MEPLHNQDVADTDNQIITNHVDIISQLPDDVLTHGPIFPSNHR